MRITRTFNEVMWTWTVRTNHDLLFYSIVNTQACKDQEQDDRAPLVFDLVRLGFYWNILKWALTKKLDGKLLPFTKLTGVGPGKEGKSFRSAAEAQLWKEKYQWVPESHTQYSQYICNDLNIVYMAMILKHMYLSIKFVSLASWSFLISWLVWDCSVFIFY